MKLELESRAVQAAFISCLVISVHCKSFYKVSTEKAVKPLTYASFIITQPQPGRVATILAEEQDKFEFPDKKIRVRVFGPNLEERRDEKVPNFTPSDDQDQELDNQFDLDIASLIKQVEKVAEDDQDERDAAKDGTKAQDVKGNQEDEVDTKNMLHGEGPDAIDQEADQDEAGTDEAGMSENSGEDTFEKVTNEDDETDDMLNTQFTQELIDGIISTQEAMDAIINNGGAQVGSQPAVQAEGTGSLEDMAETDQEEIQDELHGTDEIAMEGEAFPSDNISAIPGGVEETTLSDDSFLAHEVTGQSPNPHPEISSEEESDQGSEQDDEKDGLPVEEVTKEEPSEVEDVPEGNPENDIFGDFREEQLIQEGHENESDEAGVSSTDEDVDDNREKVPDDLSIQPANDESHGDGSQDVPVDQGEFASLAQEPTQLSLHGDTEGSQKGKSYRLEAVAENKFIQAGSVFWSELDSAVYVADSFGSAIFRYKEKGDHLSGDALLFEKGANQDDLVLAENPEDEGDLFKAEENVEKYLEKLERNQQVPSAMQNYWVSTLRLPDGVHALLGPAVPRTYNESENLVGLTVALNTHVFHDVKWSLDAEDTVMQVNISNADPVLIDARDRYNRLTFAAMDANSRLWTGSVDVRDKLSPYPCQDYLMMYDTTGTRMNVLLDELRVEDNLVCRPAAVAFPLGAEKHSFYLLDEIRATLVKIGYDVEGGGIDSHELVARYEESSGRPTAMTFDLHGNLWVGFSGIGELNCLNLESMTVMHTIKVPDVDIVGLAANEHSGDLWILTKTSLFKISEHSQLQNE